VLNVIMAPTDGSVFDRDAIRIATRLSNFPGSQLKLVRVFSAPTAFTGPDVIDYPREALDREREWEVTQLESLAADCRGGTAAAVATSLEDGPVADSLARYGRLNRVDLIVITSHARGGLARLTLGSVTDSLIRNSNIPVLVVKRAPSSVPEREAGPFRRILVPLDGSKLAEEILPQVIELAKRNDASVILVNVLVPVTYSRRQIADDNVPWWDSDLEVAQAYLGEQAEWVRSQGVSASIELTIGEDVADGVTRSASRLRADLIAIATRGRGGLSRFVRGSVADRIVRTSRVSLLVFHPKTTAETRAAAREAVPAQAGFVPAA
jgi:Universal stress protein UspA and related nucleotide-binding proteins